MPDIEIIAAILAVIILVALIAIWIKKFGLRSAGFSVGKNKNGLAHGDNASADKGRVSNEDPAVENSKLVVHALLQSVSASIESLLGDSTQYSNSLDQHKAGIRKAMTMAGIRELEKVMLTELVQIQTANVQYRQKLDDADKKIKKQKVELEKLQSDVGIDFLTKISNRRSMDTRIAEELKRTKRYNTIFSMIVVDVDYFKSVNDINGHLAGDKILRALSLIMDEQKRESDFLARYGGEEFVMVLPETSADEARILAEKIRKKVKSSKFRFERKSIKVTISAGVGEVLPKGDTAEAFFSRIDAAMYRAKNNGRNRVEIAHIEEKE